MPSLTSRLKAMLQFSGIAATLKPAHYGVLTAHLRNHEKVARVPSTVSTRCRRRLRGAAKRNVRRGGQVRRRVAVDRDLSVVHALAVHGDRDDLARVVEIRRDCDLKARVHAAESGPAFLSAYPCCERVPEQ